MNNKAIYIRKMPAANFIMKEINEQNFPINENENERIGNLFYRFAAAQIAQILIGAVLSFFVAPASLFVSRTDDETFTWLAAAFAGIAMIALGSILFALSIIASMAFRKEKKWRNFIGILTAGAGIFAFPFGTILGGILLWKTVKGRK